MPRIARSALALLTGTGVLCAALGTITVTPVTVTFESSDPDGGPVAGTPVVVSWPYTNGWLFYQWNLRVRANSATLANCGSVPVSAITVSCQSVSMSGGWFGSGACSQPFPLSTTDQQVAGGMQRFGNANYAVNIRYSFQDSWRYRGAVTPACALTLTYTVYFQD